MFKIYENSNDNIVNNLVMALKAVENYYLKQNYNRIHLGVQKPERIFTAELYHQLRILQKDKNLHFSADIIKKSYDVNPNSCIKLKDFKRISPDIVLHKEQNDTNPNNQLLVCEIKMEGASHKKIIKDFYKLLYYKISKLKFNTSAFIFTGSIETINKILSNNLELTNCIREHKIIAICLENVDTDNSKWIKYVIN